MSSQSTARRALIMAALIAAGEIVFILPFVVARIFRPTVLDVFGLTNLQLGTAFSVYGVVAMSGYFLGGPLADRYPARMLITAALLATAGGGAVFAGIPSLPVLKWLYAFWGFTTILLFWAALIRAAREWGGSDAQGRAFGLLDGGRGLLAALMASAMVAIFASLLPEDAATATLAQRTAALKQIIWIFTGLTLAVALLAWYSIPDSSVEGAADDAPRLSLEGLRRVLGMPGVWLQAVIVICAYVGYKCTDDFSLYARDAFGYDDVEAARLGTISFWVRPLAAVGAGMLGDRIDCSRAIAASFAVVTAGSLAIASGFLQSGAYWLLVLTIATTSAGIYALRANYFALFGEARVPLAFTGSAVGLVSIIGFTPDVFMGPLMGWLLDRSPGAPGHHHVFGMLAAFSVAGLVATLAFRRVTGNTRARPPALIDRGRAAP